MRYNIFNHVYRPLKETLLSTCIFLSRNDKWNDSTAFEAISKVEKLLRICDEQVKYEAINVLPFIFEYEPSVWNAYTAEHHKIMNDCRDLNYYVQCFYKSKGTDNKSAVMQLICKRFSEFVLFNYNHMDDEEAVLNEILWRYCSDSLIMKMESRMQLLTSDHQPKEKALQLANAA